MTEVVFYFFCTLTVISALFILITRNILYAAFALVVTLLSIAALYAFANAEFVAVTQIMIYVGGIVVLIVFGVMLTNDVAGQSGSVDSTNRFAGLIVGLTTLALLVYGIINSHLTNAITRSSISVEVLGRKLMTTYLLPFEVAAVLLLIALIAASMIAGSDLKTKRP